MKKLLLLGFLTILLLVIGHFLFKSPAEGQPQPYNTIPMVGQNTLIGVAVPTYFKPPVYGTLIDCLAKEESTHNPNAIGKAGEIGLLQFMPETFQMYCVDKYKLRDDIWNPEIQCLCAELMLQNNFGNILHWTTAELCL